MNKIFIILGLFAVSFSNAQEVRFAAKVGYNASYLGGDTDITGTGIKSGLHLGGVWDISFTEKISLQPELLYSAEVYDYGILLSDMSVTTSYFRVPILAKYFIFKGLSVEAGPSLGFMIAAKLDGNDVKDSFNNFNAGVGVGTTYELNMGAFISARYNLGLTNINKFDDPSVVNLKNQGNTIQISVGYFL